LNSGSDALTARIKTADPFQSQHNLSLGEAAKGLKEFERAQAAVAKDAPGLAIKMKDVEKSLFGVAVQGKGAGAALLSVVGVVGTIIAVVGAAVAVLGGLVAAKVGEAFYSFAEEGVRFNSVIENARNSIAALISNIYDIKDANGNMVTGIDAFNASLGESEGLERNVAESGDRHEVRV
jgi:hypothetical protein